mmetsp:Transcript_18833/g.40547  ORF Transcript_18833/g.40547 Transcript_18833/m.40547 type:complete len:423 (-) Transcript_18833:670-1938(-)
MAATEGNPILREYSCGKPLQLRAGAIKADQKRTYKRTYRICQNTGELDVKKAADSLPEEVVLADHALKFSGIRLLRGLWRGHSEGGLVPTSGTYFPVTPATSSSPRIFASAGHCVYVQQFRWQGTTDICAKDGVATFPYRLPAAVDLGWLKYRVSPDDLREFAPSGRHISITSDVQPDFGFVTVDDAPGNNFFIPCAPAPSEVAVGVIGYAALPTPRWAQTYLRTEADYHAANEKLRLGRAAFMQRSSEAGESSTDPTKPEPLDESAFLLDFNTAAFRVFGLLEDVVFPDNLAVAPGFITASNKRIVEHSCSTFPGMSGGPGVDLEHPWKLHFIHLTADKDFRRNVNYGISVQHELFAKAYVKEVLPSLTAAPTEVFNFDEAALPCLRNYLLLMRQQIEAAGLWATVESFFRAHGGDSGAGN